MSLSPKAYFVVARMGGDFHGITQHTYYYHETAGMWHEHIRHSTPFATEQAAMRALEKVADGERYPLMVFAVKRWLKPAVAPAEEKANAKGK